MRQYWKIQTTYKHTQSHFQTKIHLPCSTWYYFQSTEILIYTLLHRLYSKFGRSCSFHVSQNSHFLEVSVQDIWRFHTWPGHFPWSHFYKYSHLCLKQEQQEFHDLHQDIGCMSWVHSSRFHLDRLDYNDSRI